MAAQSPMLHTVDDDAVPHAPPAFAVRASPSPVGGRIYIGGDEKGQASLSYQDHPSTRAGVLCVENAFARTWDELFDMLEWYITVGPYLAPSLTMISIPIEGWFGVECEQDNNVGEDESEENMIAVALEREYQPMGRFLVKGIPRRF